ncbi:MAG: SWIM zinc finger family protein [Methanocella sp.]
MHAAGATSAGDLRKLTEPEVARLFDPRIYARGKEYFEDGRVQRPIVYHDSLMADIKGTQPEDYHVSIDVRDHNYVASCTCPYAFGYCKHIAAVMYAWVKRPSLFRDLGKSEDMLKRLGKEEIVEIVIDMIRYDPDVLYVINLRLTPAPELTAFVGREIAAIFSEEYVDYLNVRVIVKKLEIFREYAMDLSRARDLSTAITVLSPVIDAVIANYTKLDDVDDLMKNFFGAALDTFGATIAEMRDEGKRRALMTKAVDWYMDAEWGLEDQLQVFLRDATLRLNEARFMVNTVDLRVADYRRSLINTGPQYSEEHEYLDERVRRLSGLRAGILADSKRAIETQPGQL